MNQGNRSLQRRKPISVRKHEEAGPSGSGPGDRPGPGPGPSRVVGALIAYGVPSVIALIGAGAMVLWLRHEPQIPEVKPRAAAVQGAGGDASGSVQPTAQSEQEATAGARSGSGQTTGSAGGASAKQQSGSTGSQPQRSQAPSDRQTRGGSGASASVPSLPGKWPGFRGAQRDNVIRTNASLATNWGSGGPRKLWSVGLGEGYAGPAVMDGRVYVLDYDQAAKADTLRCFSLADGTELWSQSYPVVVKRNHGMSRTVPAISGQYVVTLGPKCDVMCTNAKDGSVLWRIDLVEEYGAEVPPWYAGQCPLIDRGRVILAPGGDALMIAVDPASGNVVWKAPNPNGWKMTHSSIMPAKIGGESMYVYCASGGVVGVSAADGAILWETPEWTVSTANVPTPVPIGGDRIFLSGGYNAGAMMLQVTKQGGAFTPKPQFRLRPRTFGAKQHTPILYEGHIYGVIPSGELACLDLNGKQLWTSGRTKRFGLGPFIIANGLIYVLAEDGELALAKAKPGGYQELARAKILEGPEAWGPMALAGARLLARDLTRMVCLDVGGN